MKVGMKMGQHKYSRKDIVEIIAVKLQDEIIENREKYKNDVSLLQDLEVVGEIEDVSSKFEKRFTNVMGFLSRTDVRQELANSKQYVQLKEGLFNVDISTASSGNLQGKNNAYQLNEVDMLFVSSLMLTYNHSSFTTLRRRNALILKPDEMMVDWENSFKRSLDILCELLDEKIKNLEEIKVSLVTLFQQFYPLMEKYSRGIYGDLAGIAAVFQALPENRREKIYNEKLARPLRKMKKDLLELIEEIKSSKDQKDYEEFTYNFDLEYDVYEYLNRLSDEPSLDELFSLLKNDFYDEKNENHDEGIEVK